MVSSQQTGGITGDLYGVAFSDVRNGWVVEGTYGLGTILHTSDGGATWSPQTRINNLLLTGVIFPDAQKWLGGVTRRRRHHPPHQQRRGHLVHASRWDRQLFQRCRLPRRPALLGRDHLAKRNSTILHTSNGGATWSVQVSGLSGPLNDVAFPDAQNGWAVGEGAILHTSNGGATWSTQAHGVGNYFNGVAFPDARNGWVVGWGGTILHTGNGGATWSAQRGGTTKALNSVAFPDVRNGWAVGEGGTILHTSNDGTTWVVQTSGTTKHLLGVAFPRSAVPKSRSFALWR